MTDLHRDAPSAFALPKERSSLASCEEYTTAGQVGNEDRTIKPWRFDTTPSLPIMTNGAMKTP